MALVIGGIYWQQAKKMSATGRDVSKTATKTVAETGRK
jgi:hypothetical protein